jgi:hypothetical protein
MNEPTVTVTVRWRRAWALAAALLIVQRLTSPALALAIMRIAWHCVGLQVKIGRRWYAIERPEIDWVVSYG